MKKNHLLLILIICFSLLSACTINEIGAPGIDGDYDKQIRFPLGENRSTTDSLRTNEQYDLIKFNKTNYIKVDSIVFVSRLRANIDQDTCYVDLYNATDKIVIASARLESDTTVFQLKQTKNIYNAIPAKEISLGVIIKSRNKTTLVEGGQSYLFLYRD